MKIFLDEFIIDRAAGNQKDQLSVLALMKGIRKKCDVVVFTPNLLKKYYRKIKAYEKKFRVQPKAIKSLAAFLRDSNKAIIMNNPSHAKLPPKLEGDKELVAAAMACDSEKMLMTTDQDLIDALQEESISAKYTIEPIQPEEAMEKMGY